MHPTSARSWSENVQGALEWSVSSSSASDPAAELHRRWTRKLHHVGMRTHGRSCLVDSFDLAGYRSPPFGHQGLITTDEESSSGGLATTGSFNRGDRPVSLEEPNGGIPACSATGTQTHHEGCIVFL